MNKLIFIFALTFGATFCHADLAKPANLPADVQKTIQAQQGSATVEDVTKKREDGEVVYEVKTSKDGKKNTFTVSADGSVTRRKLSLSETPVLVQKAIKAKGTDADLADITQVNDDGDITYEVEITQGKKDRMFTLDDQGGFLSELVFLDELPAAVQKTIGTKTTGAQLGEITKTGEGEEITYEVDITKASQERYFMLDAAGILLSEEVFLSELPAAVQKMIRVHSKGGQLDEITKIFGDEVTYEVDTTKDDQARTFTVSATGALLDLEVFLDETPASVQKTITTQIPEGEPDRITKIMDGRNFTYQVETTVTNQTRVFFVSSRGVMLGVQAELSDTPTAVQEAIKAQVKNGHIEKIIKNVEDGVIAYQADMTVAGKSRTFILDSDGVLTYEQESLSLSQAPDLVQKAIQAKLGAATLSTIARTSENGVISYEVESTEDSKPQSFTLNAKGEVIEPDGK